MHTRIARLLCGGGLLTGMLACLPVSAADDAVPASTLSYRVSNDEPADVQMVSHRFGRRSFYGYGGYGYGPRYYGFSRFRPYYPAYRAPFYGYSYYRPYSGYSYYQSSYYHGYPFPYVIPSYGYGGIPY